MKMSMMSSQNDEDLFGVVIAPAVESVIGAPV
jgi:hypothetical protein